MDKTLLKQLGDSAPHAGTSVPALSATHGHLHSGRDHYRVTISNQSTHPLKLVSTVVSGSFAEGSDLGCLLQHQASDHFQIFPVHAPWASGAVTLRYQMVDEPVLLTVVGRSGGSQAFNWALRGQGSEHYDCSFYDASDGSTVVTLEKAMSPHLMAI